MEEDGGTRMETFSDGVFAIAATLLVLQIGVGTGANQHLGRALIDLWPSYLAYATSFLIIGIIWVNHHECVACMARVDRTMLFINIVFLMVVAFIPFPTKLVAHHGRRLIAESVPQSKLDAISRAFAPGIVLYLVVLAVAFVNPLASVILTLILAAFYVPAGALFYRAAG